MKKLSIVFLDVDGVLNCYDTKDSIDGYIGIDLRKVKVLKEIVERTNSILVLSSSWKKEWYKDKEMKKYQDSFANYLEKKLNLCNLTLLDKTNDGNSWNRGKGIIRYIRQLEKEGIIVEHILIIDDQKFDFSDVNLTDYWLETDFYGQGLSVESIDKAINILKRDFNIKEYK